MDDSEALARALEALKPFSYRDRAAATEAEARRYARKFLSILPPCLAAEDAPSEIIRVAAAYRRAVDLFAMSSRYKTIIETLERLERQSDILAGIIESLTADDLLPFRDFALYWRDGVEVRGPAAAVAKNYLLADVVDLTKLPVPIRTPRWSTRLRALSAISGAASRHIQKWFGPDLGGTRNLFTDQYGHPHWIVVFLSAEIFEGARPGRLSGTADGAFHAFVDAVVEVAIGEHPDGMSWVSRHVKDVAQCFAKARVMATEIEVSVDRIEREIRRNRNFARIKKLELRHDALLEEQFQHRLKYLSGRNPWIMLA